eukprot:365535-Chlamydomonas_euryale.AAC.36
MRPPGHVRPAEHVLNRRDALRARGVCEHVLAIGVADAVHVRHDLAVFAEHLHLLRNRHKTTAVGLGVDRAQVESLGEGRPPRCDHACVDLERVNHLLGLEVGQLNRDRLDARHAWRDFGRNHACLVVNRARLDEQALCHSRNLLVKAWHDVVHRLDEGDLRTQRCVDIGKLKANVARADNGDPLWQPLQLQRVVTREHRLPINWDACAHVADKDGQQ